MNVQAPILVIGGNGFIGQPLVERLVSAGHNVRGLSRRPVPQFANCPGVEWIQGSFSDRDTLDDVMKGVDICYHLASSTVPQTANADPCGDVLQNLQATVGLLEAAVRSKLKRVIFTSSGGTVYGLSRDLPICEDHHLLPITSHGIVKAAIEHYLNLFQRRDGLDFITLRLSNVYGPGQRIEGVQGVIAIFMHRILHGLPIEVWGDGSTVRDFVYIDDAVSSLIAAADYSGPERVFNIGTGEGHSIVDIIGLIEQITGRSAIVHWKDAGCLDVDRNVLNIEKARRELGFAPTIDLHEGLQRTAAHQIFTRS